MYNKLFIYVLTESIKNTKFENFRSNIQSTKNIKQNALNKIDS